jgi:sucrose phosphorylase
MPRTNEVQVFAISDINLIDAQDWMDLIAGTRYTAGQGEVALAPYQTVWITNVSDQGTQ